MTLSKQPSPQFSVVQQFYNAVTTWKFDILENLLSEDYVSKILPASANVPPKNKTEGIQQAKDIGATIGYAPLKVRYRSTHRIGERERTDVFDMIPQYEIFASIEVPGSVWVHVSCQGIVQGRPLPPGSVRTTQLTLTICFFVGLPCRLHSPGSTVISRAGFRSTPNPYTSSRSAREMTSRSLLSQSLSTTSRHLPRPPPLASPQPLPLRSSDRLSAT